MSVYHECTRPIYNRAELYSEASVYHLGLFRDEVTMQPVKCMWNVYWHILGEFYAYIIPRFTDYSKLPPSPQVDSVFLLDPILG